VGYATWMRPYRCGDFFNMEVYSSPVGCGMESPGCELPRFPVIIFQLFPRE
jgi:hypothetical protein